MGILANIKRKVSPVPAFGNTGPIKFRSMSFGITDSLKAYLDATMGQTKDGKIIVTCEDAEQIIDYLPTYFENKEIEYCDSYDEYYKNKLKLTNRNGLFSVGTMIRVMTTIPVMTTGLPKRVTGYLSGLRMEQLTE